MHCGRGAQAQARGAHRTTRNGGRGGVRQRSQHVSPGVLTPGCTFSLLRIASCAGLRDVAHRRPAHRLLGEDFDAELMEEEELFGEAEVPDEAANAEDGRASCGVVVWGGLMGAGPSIAAAGEAGVLLGYLEAGPGPHGTPDPDHCRTKWSGCPGARGGDDTERGAHHLPVPDKV